MKKQLASYIYEAQAASDRGKRIKETPAEGTMKRFVDKGYMTKDICILRAINYILVHGTVASGCKFYVGKGDKCAPFLVYFNYKLNGDYRQISFHSFDKRLNKFLVNGKNYKVSWDKGNSRLNAIELAKSAGIL